MNEDLLGIAEKLVVGAYKELKADKYIPTAKKVADHVKQSVDSKALDIVHGVNKGMFTPDTVAEILLKNSLIFLHEDGVKNDAQIVIF